MGKYSSNETDTFAGMDVHARSIAVSAIDVETGDEAWPGSSYPGPAELFSKFPLDAAMGI